jgi:hypothetical protein
MFEDGLDSLKLILYNISIIFLNIIYKTTLSDNYTLNKKYNYK